LLVVGGPPDRHQRNLRQHVLPFRLTACRRTDDCFRESRRRGFPFGRNCLNSLQAASCRLQGSHSWKPHGRIVRHAPWDAGQRVEGLRERRPRPARLPAHRREWTP
jgi:hypothetical protein